MELVDREALAAPPDADGRWQTSDRIALSLIRLMRLIERNHAGKSGPDGIERAAYALLARLVLTGPQRSNALAEAVHSDPSTVSRQIGGLVRHGLVERRPDPDDGRACLLGASAEGRRVFVTNRDRRNRRITQVMADWDEQERARLAELLARLTDDLESRGDAFGSEDHPHDDDPAGLAARVEQES